MLRTVPSIGRRPFGRTASLQLCPSRLAPIRRIANSSRPDSPSKPSIRDSDPAVLPGSESTTTSSKPPPPPGIVSAGSTAPRSSPTANVPLTPPPPPGGKSQSSPSTSIPPPDNRNGTPRDPTPAPKPKRSRFRRFLLALVLLGCLGFGGGVWFSLLSDNFHDFFTEYIPFGEEAVLFFEEREFRKRFPNALNATSRRPVDIGAKITIPSKSGISSKVTEGSGSDLSTKGPHMSAIDASHGDTKEVVPKPPSMSAVKESVKESVQKVTGTKEATTSAKDEAKKSGQDRKEHQKKESIGQSAEKAAAKPMTKAKESSDSPRKSPEVNEPSVYIPLTRLDPLNIKDADEPLVQDLVKMLNDIITVVNADNASGKYNTTIAKAKSELSVIGQRIKNLKAAEKKTADDRVNATRSEFDQAAQELVRRLEGEIETQEARWRDEFASEKSKLSQSYQEQLSAEVDHTKKLLEERTKNQLLEQALALKKEFETGIKDRVETERNGRLGQLSELSESHQQLEKLTADWNAILEANLTTQHLQVAVEAVRASLERTDRPRPFIKELAALKELAAHDAAVNSAIASINPSAYQLGVPTNAQLINRFRRVADEVRKASLLPDNAGIASHAASFVLSKVMFKKQGVAVGGDVESVLTRTETLLEEGHLDQAAREMNALNGWAKTLSKDWLADLRKVLEVRQALDVISTEARLQSLKVD